MTQLIEEAMRPEFLQTSSATELMKLWESSILERFSQQNEELDLQVRAISTENYSNEKKAIMQKRLEIADRKRNHELSRDDLTGAYNRKEFFTFLHIARELGHNSVTVTACDLNFLKDYNERLGDPVGGDLGIALAAQVAQEVAQENGQLVVRFNQGGGDDFLIFGFPVEGQPPEFISQEIKNRLAHLNPNEILEGKRNGNDVYRYKPPTERIKPIIDKVHSLSAIPELLSIIIPPSFTFANTTIDPLSDIFENENMLNYQIVSEKIEHLFSTEIKVKKREMWFDLAKTNPNGVRLLARQAPQ
jgi:GGDEF domain-containing protein